MIALLLREMTRTRMQISSGATSTAGITLNSVSTCAVKHSQPLTVLCVHGDGMTVYVYMLC